MQYILKIAKRLVNIAWREYSVNNVCMMCLHFVNRNK